MMTEEEAKTKWCPHAVASHTDPRSGLREGDKGLPLHNCIGSMCMAWRFVDQPQQWAVTKDGRTQAYNYDPRKTDHFSTSEYYRDATIEEIVPDVVGFCGLAGAP